MLSCVCVSFHRTVCPFSRSPFPHARAVQTHSECDHRRVQCSLARHVTRGILRTLRSTVRTIHSHSTRQVPPRPTQSLRLPDLRPKSTDGAARNKLKHSMHGESHGESTIPQLQSSPAARCAIPKAGTQHATFDLVLELEIAAAAVDEGRASRESRVKGGSASEEQLHAPRRPQESQRAPWRRRSSRR